MGLAACVAGPRGAGGRLCVALLIAVLLAVGVCATAAAAEPVAVFPIAGSRYNRPATQITFRGVAAGQLGSIQVTGSKSGVHAGRLIADSDGDGASFVPTQPFSAGETVTVAVTGSNSGTFSFAIAQPRGLLPYGKLAVVGAGGNGVQHFRSRPDLQPASVTVSKDDAPASEGDIFLAPQFGPTSRTGR